MDKGEEGCPGPTRGEIVENRTKISPTVEVHELISLILKHAVTNRNDNYFVVGRICTSPAPLLRQLIAQWMRLTW